MLGRRARARTTSAMRIDYEQTRRRDRRRARARDHALRHRRHLRAGDERGLHRPRARGAPRPRRARDEVRQADGRAARRLRAARATTSAGPSRARCAGCAPTRSTSTRCTSPTRRRRSRTTLAALHELVAGGQGAAHRLVATSRRRRSRRPTASRASAASTRFVAAQNHYSLVEREVEDEILPRVRAARHRHAAVLPARERLLTGKYTRGEEATEGRLAGREVPDERWDRLERLQAFADERGVPLL